MTLKRDPELVAEMARRGPIQMPVIPRGDWQTLRARGEAGITAIAQAMPAHDEISRVDRYLDRGDGNKIMMRWYLPPGFDATHAGPAVVYLHGGGLITASVDSYDRVVAAYVAESNVPFLSVDYRLAPEFPHPTPADDACAALAWLAEESASLGVDPARIAVMGDSGGGCLAAGVAILARDRGIAVARQILIYPMLDDRNTEPDPELAEFTVGWTYDSNYTAWHALLGDRLATADVPPEAAPARLSDARGMAPAYVEVGELDIFRDESIAYARVLQLAGVSAELHVHPGCSHGFDFTAPGAAVVQRARADRLRVITSL